MNSLRVQFHVPRQLFPKLSQITRVILKSPLFALLLFLFCYLFAVIYCSTHYYRDPTSLFFSLRRAHDRRYSLHRQREADDFISSVFDPTKGILPQNGSVQDSPPVMCIALATVKRPGDQIVRSTIGSLLSGMSTAERQQIQLLVSIGHTDPLQHPIYSESWLLILADKVMTYKEGDPLFNQLKEWEEQKAWRLKTIYDYSAVLHECYNTGASYITILEDDVLAVRGWYSRALEALVMIDDQTNGIDDSGPSWFYTRLFFTEVYLGWQSEDLLEHILASAAIVFAVIVSQIVIRTIYPPFQKPLSNPNVLITSLFCVPALIALYFCAGKLSMRPLQPGVYRMEENGCCSQGFVFLRDTVPETVRFLQNVAINNTRGEYLDSLLESKANAEQLVRWVVMPSLLQHIGSKSSKGQEFDTQADNIWSFGFEEFDHDGLA